MPGDRFITEPTGFPDPEKAAATASQFWKEIGKKLKSATKL